MKKALAILLLFLCCADAHGQLFGRRRGGYSPGVEYLPYSGPSSPPATDSVPDWAVKATCEVHAGNAGGTGGICHYDSETGKCYILTCRHVVSRQTSPLYVKLADGSKKNAEFLGYSGSSDLALLEIDSSGVDGFVEVFEGDIYNGQEVYQVGYGINASNRGTVNKRAGKVVRPSGYVGESSYDVSFMLISGDSGSPIFDAKTQKLMGVGWGHDGRNGKITGPKECREFLLTCLRRKNRNPPKLGDGIKGSPKTEPKKEPTAPTKPAEPAKPITEPAKPEPPKPCPEVKQVIAKVDELNCGLLKLTDATSKLADNVGGLGARLSAVEQRLSAAEKARCACQGAGGAPVTSPPAVKDPELTKLQEDFAKLKQSLRAGGTLNLRIEQKQAP